VSRQLDIGRIKKELLFFTEKRVAEFLEDNSGLVFYAFALDCNAEYAEVSLCFNTESCFEEDWKSYHTGSSFEFVQTEEHKYDFRYNTGNWEYQCFATTYVLTKKELAKIYKKDIEKQTDELMSLFCEALLDFTFTDVYSSIPKTDNFKILCLDHDESVEDVESRLNHLEYARRNTKE